MILGQILFRFGTETTPTFLWFFDLPVPLKFDIDTKKKMGFLNVSPFKYSYFEYLC